MPGQQGWGLQSFRHKAAATWNSLPDHARCMHICPPSINLKAS